jgi:hypothetical protein
VNAAAEQRDLYDALLLKLDQWSVEVETDRNRPALQRSRTPLTVSDGHIHEDGSTGYRRSIDPARRRDADGLHQSDGRFAKFAPAPEQVSEPYAITPFAP